MIVWRSAGSAFIQPGHDSDLTQCVKNHTENIFLSTNEKRRWEKKAANVGRRSETENEVKLGTEFNLERGDGCLHFYSGGIVSIPFEGAKHTKTSKSKTATK